MPLTAVVFNLPSLEAHIPAAKSFQKQGYAVFLVTNRPESLRGDTITYLWDYDIPFDALYMFPDDEPDTYRWRLHLLRRLRGQGHTILLAVDDDEDSLVAYRGENIPCFITTSWIDKLTKDLT